MEYARIFRDCSGLLCRSPQILTLVGVLAGLWIGVSICSSETIFVPGYFPTIQAAIDYASDGDSVVVSSGTFRENLLIEGKSIRLLSVSGAQSTIIDGSTPTRPDTLSVIAMIASQDVLIQGFTIRNGTGGTTFGGFAPPKSGGGFFAIVSQGVVKECVITENQCEGNGGGLELFASSMTVENCIIRGNAALQGGGVSIEAGPSHLLNSDIVDNRAGWGCGVYTTQGSPVLEGLLVQGNRNETGNYGCGGGIHLYSGLAEIKTCTIVGNANVCAGGVSFDTASLPSSVTNCIVAQNTDLGVLCYQSNPSLSCNDIFGNGSDALCGVDGGGNINLDPLFCSSDWTLQDGSPCTEVHSPSGCGLVGARPVACVSAVEPTTWGRIKAAAPGRWR